jgi:hypothetical protein
LRTLTCILLTVLIVSVGLSCGGEASSTPDSELEPTPTPIATPTPQPTPSPTPKIVPGSPLSLGGATFAETISQFDLGGLAKIVLIILGIIWVIVILVYVDKEFGKKDNEKPKT